MNTKRVLWSVLTVMTLAFAASARADDGVTMTRTYKAGDVLRYKLVMNGNAMGQDFTLTMSTKDEVKEVKPNGDVTITETTEKGKISVGGQDIDLPDEPPSTVTRDKFGKLIDHKASEGGEGQLPPEVQRLMAMLQETILSDKPVKSGDTWKIEQDNPAVKGKKVVIKETYNGIEKVDGADLWKVKEIGEADTDEQGGKMSYDSTAWLDPTNGHAVKAEGTMKGVPSPQGPVDITMKMTLIKSGGNDKKL